MARRSSTTTTCCSCRTSTAPGINISTRLPTAFPPGSICSGTPASNIRTRSRSVRSRSISAPTRSRPITTITLRRARRSEISRRRFACDVNCWRSPIFIAAAMRPLSRRRIARHWPRLPIRWRRRATRRSRRLRRRMPMLPAANSSPPSQQSVRLNMPNLDGGHYFLTVLAPIRVDLIADEIPGRSRSHRQQLAQKLALLATGRQTAASPPDAWPSPFAANTLNHMARFVIIGGPPYNGRLSGDTLLGVLRDINPLIPQPVDRLSVPYLLFAADIDAPGDADDALRAYTDTLWATMKDDLEVIFGHCAGFDGVDTAEKFYGYTSARSRPRCHSTTTGPTGFRSGTRRCRSRR